MKLSSVQKNRLPATTRNVTVEFSDDPADHLHATVRVLGMTDATKVRMDALQGGATLTAQEVISVCVAVLSELVSEWDLAGEDGPIAPTAEALTTLPPEDLLTITMGLAGAVKADPFVTTSTSSKRSSSTARKPRKR